MVVNVFRLESKVLGTQDNFFIRNGQAMPRCSPELTRLCSPELTHP